MGEFRPSKPGERRGGRQKGTTNKATAALKDMILAALDKAGGIDYLHAQSGENPAAFMTLVGKVLPLQVTGENGPLVIEIVKHADYAQQSDSLSPDGKQ